MSPLMLIPAFMFGLTAGVFISFQLAGWIAKRALDKALKPMKDQFEFLKKMAGSEGSVIEDRLNKVSELTEEQLDLQRMADGPQRNAMDGKYKNGVNGRIKALEQEKVDILKSLLAEGFDPAVRVQDSNGKIKEMALSEYMAYGVDGAPPVTEESKSKTKQVGKFTVYKGGKDDGTNH